MPAGRVCHPRSPAWLAEPGAYPVSYRLDVELVELEPLGNHARVHVHHGTTETPARLVRVGDRFAQLRLASPVVAACDDRVVLRDRTTLGEGRILETRFRDLLGISRRPASSCSSASTPTASPATNAS